MCTFPYSCREERQIPIRRDCCGIDLTAQRHIYNKPSFNEYLILLICSWLKMFLFGEWDDVYLPNVVYDTSIVSPSGSTWLTPFVFLYILWYPFISCVSYVSLCFLLLYPFLSLRIPISHHILLYPTFISLPLWLYSYLCTHLVHIIYYYI